MLGRDIVTDSFCPNDVSTKLYLHFLRMPQDHVQTNYVDADNVIEIYRVYLINRQM